MSGPPLWRQAFDAVEGRVTPQAEKLVRTPGFAVGAALAQRAQALARASASGVSARAWHLLNLPAGTDVARLRGQLGALDREVRRLTVQLELAQRAAADDEAPTRTTQPQPPTRRSTSDADTAVPADGPRPRPARRRAQRPARP